MMYTPTPDFYNDYIEHHGVKEQKWGVRNGPPYPLSSKISTGKRLKGRVKVSRKTFRSPEELSNYMKTFRYSEFSGLKSPKEVSDTKTGSCHDQVMYELDELRKQEKNPKATFWIEVDPKTGQGGMTHSYVYYKDGKDIKYFENAWGDHEGIKTFKSSNEIMDYFKDQHNSGNVGDSKKYSEMIFCNFNDKNHKIGESLQDLVNICLDDEIIYKKK